MPELNCRGDQCSDHNLSGSADPILEHIQDAIHGLRFGSVLIVVQDGVVVQIDRTEKRRLPRTAN
jgi:hypothetical protein